MEATADWLLSMGYTRSVLEINELGKPGVWLESRQARGVIR